MPSTCNGSIFLCGTVHEMGARSVCLYIPEVKPGIKYMFKMFSMFLAFSVPLPCRRNQISLRYMDGGSDHTGRHLCLAFQVSMAVFLQLKGN